MIVRRSTTASRACATPRQRADRQAALGGWQHALGAPRRGASRPVRANARARFAPSADLLTWKELPATGSQLKALSWHCFPPFDSSPNGEPLIGGRIRQVADLPPLEAGGWKLTALFWFNHPSDRIGPLVMVEAAPGMPPGPDARELIRCLSADIPCGSFGQPPGGEHPDETPRTPIGNALNRTGPR